MPSKSFVLTAAHALLLAVPAMAVQGHCPAGSQEYWCKNLDGNYCFWAWAPNGSKPPYPNPACCNYWTETSPGRFVKHISHCQPFDDPLNENDSAAAIRQDIDAAKTATAASVA